MQVTVSFANAMDYMKKKNRGAGGFKQFFTFQIYPLDRHGLRKEKHEVVGSTPTLVHFFLRGNYGINLRLI